MFEMILVGERKSCRIDCCNRHVSDKIFDVGMIYKILTETKRRTGVVVL